MYTPTTVLNVRKVIFRFVWMTTPFTQIRPGDLVELLAELPGGWGCIRLPDGSAGLAKMSYLVPVGNQPHPPDPVPSTGNHKALVGLHAPSGPYTPAIYEAYKKGRIEAAKLMTIYTNKWQIDQLGDIFKVSRIYYQFHSDPVTPQQFIAANVGQLNEAYAAGVRWFEVHNEPNMYQEGFGSSWSSGRSFGLWYNEVVDLLKAQLPGAKAGFPGLSPGEDNQHRADSTRFMQEAMATLDKSRLDFICLHVYWGGHDYMGRLWTWEMARDEVNRFARTWSNYPVIVSEFSSGQPQPDKAAKAREYVKFYQADYEPNVKALMCFIAGATHGFEHETWVEEDCTKLTDIPRIVGER